MLYDYNDEHYDALKYMQQGADKPGTHKLFTIIQLG